MTNEILFLFHYIFNSTTIEHKYGQQARPVRMCLCSRRYRGDPLAIACTVLSLVESSAVGRSIANETGQRLNTSVEFAGQGLANIVAAFSGAYPTSGSLSRSALNHQAGGETRMSGVFAGLMMILVLLKDFICNISKPQILWTRGGAILLKGLNFQRLIFLKGTKKAGCPRLPRLLLKTSGYLC